MFTLIVITLILFSVFFVVLDIYLDIYLKIPKKNRVLFVIGGMIIIALLSSILIKYTNTPTIEDYVHGKVATEVTYTLEDGWLQKCDTIYKYNYGSKN